MKEQLEIELNSIAHRLLKIKEEMTEIYHSVSELQDKLSTFTPKEEKLPLEEPQKIDEKPISDPFFKVENIIFEKKEEQSCGKEIKLNLNDRIAFEKNLFDNNSEYFAKVLNNLNQMTSFQDSLDFINDLVKPDFKYWKGKEEYEERFLEIIKQKFD